MHFENLPHLFYNILMEMELLPVMCGWSSEMNANLILELNRDNLDGTFLWSRWKSIACFH